MSSAFAEIENALILRSHFITDQNAEGSDRYTNIKSIAAASFAVGETDQLAQSVANLVSSLGLSEDVVLDSEVGNLLGTLESTIDIPSVAANVKYIFDTVSNTPTSVELNLTNEPSAFTFALATAVATASIISVTATAKESDPNALADLLLEQAKSAPVVLPILEFHEEPFSPSAYTFDVERIIRLNTEFEDHNIEAIRYKSFTGTKDSNLPFADMSRSLASFVWAINRTIDLHRDDSFVYDFDRLGTEHIARISRSWGIKDIELLAETVEAVMKGIGSIYESGESTYSFPLPSLEGAEYGKYRYIFNVAMASISSAHVYLFASNFDSTQSGVYGEVRRTIKEVQDERS